MKYLQLLSHYLCSGHQLWAHRKFSPHSSSILEKTNYLVVGCCLVFCVFKPHPCCSCLPLRFCSWGSILHLGFVTHKDRNMPCFTLKDSSLQSPSGSEQPAHSFYQLHLGQGMWSFSSHSHLQIKCPKPSTSLQNVVQS